MTETPTLTIGRRTLRRVWILAFVLFIIALAFSIWFMGPSPPRQIVIATGDVDGAYADLGRQYEQRLNAMGLQTKLHNTQGSVENFQLLLNGTVDVALVQAGSYELVKDRDTKEQLRGIVAIQWEPVWVIYRGDQVSKLTDFAGKRISVGARESGSAAVALKLLQANGIDANDAQICHLSMKETEDRLRDGTIDAGFFVTSGHNKIIQELLKSKNVHLLSFGRHLAYSQRFSYLNPVTLGEGVIDLEENIPPHDVKMFATTTVLVCREDLHPRAVEQILIAAKRIHVQRPLFASQISFPTQKGMDIPVHETASAYMVSGESVVSKLLPYWGVWLLFKFQILLIPLLVFWLPFLRIFPFAYTFRINWLLRRLYVALREIENRIEKSATPEEVQEQIQELDALKKTMERVARKIPSHLQINVYQWRLHVSHVRAEARDRLWQMQAEAQARKTALSDSKRELAQGG